MKEVKIDVGNEYRYISFLVEGKGRKRSGQGSTQDQQPLEISCDGGKREPGNRVQSSLDWIVHPDKSAV